MPHLGIIELRYIFAIKYDFAGGRLYKAQYRATGSGLAAARLSNQTKGISCFKVKAYVVHRMKHSAVGLEVFFKVAYLQ